MALVFLLGVMSCARWPSLAPVRSDVDWSRAQVILIGRVLWIARGPSHLLRARVAVENVLQGEPGGSTVDAYCSGNHPAIERHERYAFVLVRDQGVLRADNVIPITSGFHRTAMFAGRPPAEQLSAMLLTPGDGINPARFARDLAGAAAIAVTHIGRWQTAKLLRRLTADERVAIAESACVQLTKSYWGQDACWDRLEATTPSGGVAESRAAERDHRARTADPDRWWKQMSAAMPPGELLDELRLLATHKDPRIRALYCRFLRAHYPDERDCGCGEARVAGASI